MGRYDRRKVVAGVIHELYGRASLKGLFLDDSRNDIALLLLDKPSTMEPIATGSVVAAHNMVRDGGEGAGRRGVELVGDAAGGSGSGGGCLPATTHHALPGQAPLAPLCAALTPPPSPAAQAPGESLWAIGWGATCDGCDTANLLMEVELPWVSDAQCLAYYTNPRYTGGYPHLITSSMICAGAPDDSGYSGDTCQVRWGAAAPSGSLAPSAGSRVSAEAGAEQPRAGPRPPRPPPSQGDSGGPLLWMDPEGLQADILIGIVSWGVSCGGVQPGVYTDVGAMSAWIDSHAKGLWAGKYRPLKGCKSKLYNLPAFAGSKGLPSRYSEAYDTTDGLLAKTMHPFCHSKLAGAGYASGITTARKTSKQKTAWDPRSKKVVTLKSTDQVITSIECVPRGYSPCLLYR